MEFQDGADWAEGVDAETFQNFAELAAETAAQGGLIVPQFKVWSTGEDGLSTLDINDVGRYGCFNTAEDEVDRAVYETDLCYSKRPRFEGYHPVSATFSGGRGGPAGGTATGGGGSTGGGGAPRDKAQSLRRFHSLISQHQVHVEKSVFTRLPTHVAGSATTKVSFRSKGKAKHSNNGDVSDTNELQEDDDQKDDSSGLAPATVKSIRIPDEERAARQFTALQMIKSGKYSYSEIKGIIEVNRKLGVPPSLAVYKELIKLASHHGKPLDIVDLYDEMKLDNSISSSSEDGISSDAARFSLKFPTKELLSAGIETLLALSLNRAAFSIALDGNTHLELEYSRYLKYKKEGEFQSSSRRRNILAEGDAAPPPTAAGTNEDQEASSGEASSSTQEFIQLSKATFELSQETWRSIFVALLREKTNVTTVSGGSGSDFALEGPGLSAASRKHRQVQQTQLSCRPFSLLSQLDERNQRSSKRRRLEQQVNQSQRTPTTAGGYHHFAPLHQPSAIIAEDSAFDIATVGDSNELVLAAAKCKEVGIELPLGEKIEMCVRILVEFTGTAAAAGGGSKDAARGFFPPKTREADRDNNDAVLTEVLQIVQDEVLAPRFFGSFKKALHAAHREQQQQQEQQQSAQTSSSGTQQNSMSASRVKGLATTLLNILIPALCSVLTTSQNKGATDSNGALHSDQFSSRMRSLDLLVSGFCHLDNQGLAVTPTPSAGSPVVSQQPLPSPVGCELSASSFASLLNCSALGAERRSALANQLLQLEASQRLQAINVSSFSGLCAALSSVSASSSEATFTRVKDAYLEVKRALFSECSSLAVQDYHQPAESGGGGGEEGVVSSSDVALEQHQEKESSPNERVQKLWFSFAELARSSSVMDLGFVLTEVVAVQKEFKKGAKAADVSAGKRVIEDQTLLSLIRLVVLVLTEKSTSAALSPAAFISNAAATTPAVYSEEELTSLSTLQRISLVWLCSVYGGSEEVGSEIISHLEKSAFWPKSTTSFSDTTNTSDPLISAAAATINERADFYINVVDDSFFASMVVASSSSSASASVVNTMEELMKKYDSSAGGMLVVSLLDIVGLLLSSRSGGGEGSAAGRSVTPIPAGELPAGNTNNNEGKKIINLKRKEKKELITILLRWVTTFKWFTIVPFTMPPKTNLPLPSALASCSASSHHHHPACDIALRLKTIHKKVVLLLGSVAESSSSAEIATLATQRKTIATKETASGEGFGLKPVLSLDELLARLKK